MVLYFSGIQQDSSAGFVYTYTGADAATLEKAVDGAMTSLGYKHLGKGLYEKGSRTMRLLFGAFCKYFKFQVSIDYSNPEQIKLQVRSATSGVSGGAIGMGQINKEMGYMKKVFQSI